MTQYMTQYMKRAVAVAALLVIQLAVLAVTVSVRSNEHFHISRKSSLYDAGVTLQAPQVRALTTGGR
jgi:hypothetical protein